ncbi:MAG: hypothetical protein ACE5IL_00395 [Myxococcota bacterium]
MGSTACGLAATLALLALWPSVGHAAGDSQRIEQLEDSVRSLADQLTELRRERSLDRAQGAELESRISGLQGLMGRVQVGGYGSLRWENSSLGGRPDSFTLRRLVLTTAAQISDRLRFYSEIEYERFRAIELERSTLPVRKLENVPEGLRLTQEIEGTDGSEIALEQAWIELDLRRNLRFRAGALLVPVGRFNRSHDDDRWNGTRRSLIDRGAPVLPVPAAWDELGVGLQGERRVGEGQILWELYVMNGAALGGSLEQVAAIRNQPGGKRDKIALELEMAPQNGPFSIDTKQAKAFAGRLAWQPASGSELALSFYRGRYTPDYLAGQSLSIVGADGIGHLGGLEIEGEYLWAHYGGVPSVARSLARRALESSVQNSAAFDPTVETEIEVALKGLADDKHGYWVELRYPLWPDLLRGTWLDRGFSNPQLIPILRWEQVFFRDRVAKLGFSGGAVQQLATENRTLSRITTGLSYRPTPLVALTLAYEYLVADGRSLDGLTTFLRSRTREVSAHFLTAGVTFGF